MTLKRWKAVCTDLIRYSDIQSDLAQDIARGDVDPITLLPMEDINPIYAPRSIKLPLTVHPPKRTDQAPREGKQVDKPCDTSILNFFCALLLRR